MASPPPAAPLFKKRRARPGGIGGAGPSTGAAASASASSAARRPAADDDADDDEGPAVVVRSRNTAAGTPAAGSSQNKERNKGVRGALPRPAVAAGEAGEREDEAFTLRRSALADAARSSLASLPEQSSAGPSSSASAYTPAALAALKASTPTLSRAASQGGNGVDADMDDADASGANETLIPSAARVRELKERRRAAAAGGAAGQQQQQSADFIALGEGSEPHPSSRMVREEDEAEEEDAHAGFTGSSERIALGDEARKKEQRRKRQELRELVEQDDEGSADSQDEWEKAQMGRMGFRTKEREPSPYRPASIPAVVPLPTLSGTSGRLSLRLKELEEAISSHERVRDDAARGMVQLEEEERANKEQVVRAGDMEAWFRELDDFVLSLASLLEKKMPALIDTERAAASHLAERARLVQRARAKQMEDELALFHGVPELSLLPPLPLRADAEPDEVPEAEPSPGDDGEALSAVREARRHQPAVEDLRPEDAAAFTKAWQGISTRLDELLSDVQAPEYRSPAAQVERHGALAPHPASLVARFADWRTRYADEYAGAWGGLALSGAWEFWVRREMGAWDALRCAAGAAAAGSGAPGPQGLDAFEWHAQLSAYAEALPEPSGGDEEAVGNVVSTVVVPLLVARAERGAYDPWSELETRGAIELVEQVGYVLERDGWRFQSLVAAHIAPFRAHVSALTAALDGAVVHAAPSFHPLSPPARLSFVRRLVGLLRQLGRWNRYVGPGERPAYAQTVDALLDRLIWPLLQQSSDTGGKDVAKEVMAAVPPTLLPAELRTRLLAYVGS